MNKKKITVALAAVFFIGYIIFDSMDGKFFLFEVLKNDYRYVTSLPDVRSFGDWANLGLELVGDNFSSVFNIG